MLGTQKRWQEELFVAGPLSSLIPDDHILKRIDKIMDLSWLRDEVKNLYCMSNGYEAMLRARRRHLKPDKKFIEIYSYSRHRWKVEGMHGEAKTLHGLRRAVRRGLANVAIQASK